MARFSKKHYEAIADVLQVIRNGHPLFKNTNTAGEDAEDTGFGHAMAEVERQLIELFAVDNEAFDPDRFHRATMPTY